MITLGSATVVIIITILLSTAGLLVVRQKLHFETLKLSHDVADPLLSVVGTMFAVLLGFMVANAMQRFEEARVTTQQEASAVANIYRASCSLPEPVSSDIRHSCRDYVDLVINDEWPKLGTRKSSEAAWEAYGKIWQKCTKFRPENNQASNLQQGLTGYLGSLGDSRRMRIGALHNGLPPTLWVVLFLGGSSTIVFTYFFGIAKLALQIVMTSLVALAICLNLYLLASYDDPFSGDVMVHPSAFESVRDDFKRIEQEQSAASAHSK